MNLGKGNLDERFDDSDEDARGEATSVTVRAETDRSWGLAGFPLGQSRRGPMAGEAGARSNSQKTTFSYNSKLF